MDNELFCVVQETGIKCACAKAEDLGTTSGTAPRADCGAVMSSDALQLDEPLLVDSERESQKALRDCDLFLAAATSGRRWEDSDLGANSH